MRERAVAMRAISLLASLSVSLTVAGCGSSGCPQGSAGCPDGAVDAAGDVDPGDRGVETSIDGGDGDSPSAADVGTAVDGRDATDDGGGAAGDGRDVTDDAGAAVDARDVAPPEAAPFTDGPAEDRASLSDASPDASDAPISIDVGGTDGAPASHTETSKCAAGRVRVHIRDLWSNGVTPTLGLLPDAPGGLVLQDMDQFSTFGARRDSAVDGAGNACTYYSACIPNTIKRINFGPMFATGCEHVSRSTAIDISAVNRSGEFWIEYTGTSVALKKEFSDYTAPAPQGPGHFQVTSDSSTLVAPACKIGTPPPQTALADTIRVHFRWPWTDPIKTGYPGAACTDDALGYSPPPYPTSLEVRGTSCPLRAYLELQDGSCTWYSVVFPKNQVPINAELKIWFEYSIFLGGPSSADITLPTTVNPTAREFWIAFTGLKGDGGVDASTSAVCSGLRYNDVYTVTTYNPGPAFAGCGGN